MVRSRPLAAHAAFPLLALAFVALPVLAGCAAAPPPAAASGAVAPKDNEYDGPPWPRALDHASTPETHRAAVAGLFEAMHIQRVLEVALDNSLKMQLDANPKIRPFEKVMRTFMGKYLSLDAIREPVTDLYVSRFSELEIVQLTAFYKTPVGEHTLVELPKVLEESSKIGLALVQEHMDELKAMIRDQMLRGGGPSGDE